MLANRFSGQDVAGWWLSEKFDGVRAFWDGEVIRTRTWRAVAAPKWFTAQLPNGIALDGELWGGRGTFQLASELARFQRGNDSAWLQMRYAIFDAPTTDAVRVEQRIERAAELARGDFAFAVTHRVCTSGSDALAAMREIVSGGGEGCVVKRPGSCYAFERSSDWLKIKPPGVD
jgi:DNA ligase-1